MKEKIKERAKEMKGLSTKDKLKKARELWSPIWQIKRWVKAIKKKMKK